MNTENETPDAPTPETDAHRHNMGSVAEPHYVVDEEFAQDLERRLAAAQAALKAWDDEWPGGLDEAEAAWKNWKATAEKAEAALKEANKRFTAPSEGLVEELLALCSCIEGMHCTRCRAADALRGSEAREASAWNALAEIREVWAGAEVGEPVHAQEAYAIRLCKQMYEIAIRALRRAD